MALVLAGGIKNLPCAAIALHEGYLYYINSGVMTLYTTVAQVIAGIAVESSIDDLGDAKTLSSGQMMPFFTPGCGKIVKVASKTGVTWTLSQKVYGGQTATTDGLADDTGTNGAILLGHYMGPNGVATTADGDLIDVALDVPIGGI